MNFIDKLNVLQLTYTNINKELQESVDGVDRNDLIVKHEVLKKYVSDVNENIQDLINNLNNIDNIIKNQSYSEEYEKIKRDVEINNHYIKTFGPFISLYSLI